MRLHFTALVLLLLSATPVLAATGDDEPLSITPPKQRSADQMQCLKENAQNHAGYLACIRAKKGLKDDDSQNTSAPTAPLDSGMGSSIR